MRYVARLQHRMKAAMLRGGFPPTGTLLIGVMLGLVVYIFVAVACGAIMKGKGRSGTLGFALAFCLGIIGILIVVFTPATGSDRSLPRNRSSRNFASASDAWLAQQADLAVVTGPLQICTFCGSKIPLDASICRVCRVEVGAGLIPNEPPA